MKLNLNHGLGCALLYKCIFDDLLHHERVDVIEYTMAPSGLRDEYPEEFQTTLLATIDTLFGDPRIIHRPTATYPTRTPRDLMQLFDLPNRLPMRVPALDAPNPLEGRYITLNMKVTDVPRTLFETVLPTLLVILRESRYPIVLTGERELTPCREYEIHKASMFSMYPSVRDHLPSAVDRTYSETRVANALDTLRGSAQLYQHATHNVLLNSSGGFSLAAVFGNLIALTTPDCPTIEVMELKNSIVTHTMEHFLTHLRLSIGAR